MRSQITRHSVSVSLFWVGDDFDSPNLRSPCMNYAGLRRAQHIATRGWMVASRHLLTSGSLPSDAYTKSSTTDVSVSGTPELTPTQHACLDKAIRVDQAGEIAANYIYKGQMDVLGRDRKLKPVIQVRCFTNPTTALTNVSIYSGNVGPGEETY